MHLQRARDSGDGGWGATCRRWLVCTGLSMAVGTLLVACVEGTDTRAVAVTPQSARGTIESPNAGETQGLEGPSADGVGGAIDAENDEQNAEATMDDGAAKPAAGEANEDGRGDNPDEVTTSPDESEAGSPDGSGAGEAPGSQDSPPDRSEGGGTLSDVVSLVGGDVLPPVQQVSGTDVKLDGVLLELLGAMRAGGQAGALAYAEQHQPGLSVDGLRVQIVCESADEASTVREQIAATGGTVTTSFENYVWAEVSLDTVEGLAESEAIWTISVSQAVVQPGRH